jgi:hypothetical protein
MTSKQMFSPSGKNFCFLKSQRPSIFTIYGHYKFHFSQILPRSQSSHSTSTSQSCACGRGGSGGHTHCMHRHTRTDTQTHTHTHIRTYAHTHIRTYAHTHTRTHARTHAHTHTHTQTLSHSLTHSLTHTLSHTHTPRVRDASRRPGAGPPCARLAPGIDLPAAPAGCCCTRAGSRAKTCGRRSTSP